MARMMNVGNSGIAAYRNAAQSAVRPERMVAMGFAGLSEYLKRADQAFSDGDVGARAAALDGAYRIVEHLWAALDPDSDAEAAGNLADLYWFLLDRLSRANIFDSREVLAECGPVVDNLREAWDQVADDADGRTRAAP